VKLFDAKGADFTHRHGTLFDGICGLRTGACEPRALPIALILRRRFCCVLGHGPPLFAVNRMKSIPNSACAGARTRALLRCAICLFLVLSRAVIVAEDRADVVVYGATPAGIAAAIAAARSELTVELVEPSAASAAWSPADCPIRISGRSRP
jgi:NADPH-dependent 2,4-dienoyl-CoA reductase/sulfur reductase-like enzyme